MQQGAYSNLLLDSLLSELDDGRERQFAAQLFYGVLERDVTIRWMIRCLTGNPEKKTGQRSRCRFVDRPLPDQMDGQRTGFCGSQ